MYCPKSGNIFPVWMSEVKTNLPFLVNQSNCLWDLKGWFKMRNPCISNRVNKWHETDDKSQSVRYKPRLLLSHDNDGKETSRKTQGTKEEMLSNNSDPNYCHLQLKKVVRLLGPSCHGSNKSPCRHGPVKQRRWKTDDLSLVASKESKECLVAAQCLIFVCLQNSSSGHCI